MSVELSEIQDFLARSEPFDRLPARVLTTLPSRLSIRYFRRGTTLFTVGQQVDEVLLVRSGAADVLDVHGTLRDRRGVGAAIGVSGALTGEPLQLSATAIEDTLAYVFPSALFRELVETETAFGDFFRARQAARLHQAVVDTHQTSTGEPILRASIRDLVRRPPLFVERGTSVRECARAMQRERLSSVLVMDGSQLIGIVTDKDLRNRVIAEDRDPGSPIEKVMTRSPVTASAEGMAFQLLVEMVEKNIHHVPIMDGTRVIGVITSTDLMRLQNANPIYLVGELAKLNDAEGVAAVAHKLPQVVRQLVDQDTSADDIGRVVTAIGDAVERRLLAIAESRLGYPPMPYSWVVLGSQARLEQGLHSDQDNALVLARDPDPDEERYFIELAAEVTSGLALAGYTLCRGEVMATNPKWRLSVAGWRRTFTDWVKHPEPMAVMHSTIFFDMRPLNGATNLVDDLRTEVLGMTPSATSFLVHLTKQAVARRPPIGFFREFVLEDEGEHSDKLDLKHRGVATVVELARVYALSLGLPQVNTQTRLSAAAETGRLSAAQVADLKDAFEFIAYVRLRHQGRQVAAGETPDNYVNPQELSSVERRHLRDAFQVVRKAQNLAAQSFPLQYVS